MFEGESGSGSGHDIVSWVAEVYIFFIGNLQDRMGELLWLVLMMCPQAWLLLQ